MACKHCRQRCVILPARRHGCMHFILTQINIFGGNRKVRCDGQKPKCSLCTRLKRPCDYVKVTEEEKRGAARQEAQVQAAQDGRAGGCARQPQQSRRVPPPTTRIVAFRRPRTPAAALTPRCRVPTSSASACTLLPCLPVSTAGFATTQPFTYDGRYPLDEHRGQRAV
ncbi:hypothetical protein L1887_50291 [Cichorium endivia]|nr:hypothetical protein L1887_50291 [Cichorium endivia]